MRLIACAVLAASLVTVPVTAVSAQRQYGNWTQIHTLENGRVFIDRDTLERRGGTFFIRSRIEYHRPTDENVQMINMLFRYDCAAHSAALLSFVQYRPNGSVVREVEVPADRIDVQNAAQGSPNDSILNDICR